MLFSTAATHLLSLHTDIIASIKKTYLSRFLRFVAETFDAHVLQGMNNETSPAQGPTEGL